MGKMSEEEQKVITYAKDLMSLYKYGTPLKYGEDENETIKTLLEIIEKRQHIIEGQECVIETQGHNEEVLMEYFNRHTCLRCGKGKPAYCEDCYQELIAENASLQKERNGIYEDYQDLGKEKYFLEEQVELQNMMITDMAEDLVDYYADIDKEHDDIITYTVPKTVEEVKEFYMNKEVREECTDKEWQHCRVEKMGCEGCYYE